MTFRTYGTGELEDISLVTVPIPSQMQTQYGVHATTGHQAVRLMQRYSREHHDVISKAAATLNLTLSAFIKESAYNVAKAIQLKEQNHAKHDIRS